MDRILRIGLLVILTVKSCYGEVEKSEVCVILSGKIDMMSKEMTSLRNEVMETKESLKLTKEALALAEEKISEMQLGANNQGTETNQTTGPIDDDSVSVRNLLRAFQDETRLSGTRAETILQFFSALSKDSRRIINRRDTLSRQTHISLLNEIIAVLNRFSEQPRSCLDLYRADKNVRSGVYVIQTTRNESLKVFCQFDCNSGYMFLSSESMRTVQSTDLPPGPVDHVVIRHQRNDGSQFESRMEQISRYRDLPLSVQVNQNVGYNDIQNKNMGPYLYLGFTPKSKVSRGDIEGYSIFGQDITFSNCDGNPNSYFVFLFNHNNADFTSYRHDPTPISREWINRSKSVAPSAYLPCGFFVSFELHFGGCGAYATDLLMDDVTSATLGLPFSYE